MGKINSKKDDMVNRRQLIKGSAWAVPVVAVAVSAPLAAATSLEPDACATVSTDFFLINEAQDEKRQLQESMNSAAVLCGRSRFRVDAGSEASVFRATLTVTVAAAGLDPNRGPKVAGAGWSAGSVFVEHDVAHFTFLFSGNVPPAKAFPELVYTLWGVSRTERSGALPKTATGTLTGNFRTVTSQQRWG